MNAVLVVEDEQNMRALLARWLVSSGYLANAAGSAEEALMALRARPADVAVCDVRMPGRDGVWLAGAIRERFPNTAIVLATSSPEEIAVSQEDGVVECLRKPFGRERLHAAVERALEWHHAAETRSWRDTLRRRAAWREAQLTDTFEGLPIDSVATADAAVAALFAGDPAARDHARRVARLSVRVARELMLGPEESADLEVAALLHDVGKLAVPEAVLSKPASLTCDERAILRRAPEVAYELVCERPFFRRSADLMRHVNERFDGAGYPDGRAGSQIPLGSRIIAVADAYDAMTHRRAHRDAVPGAEAILELVRCCGLQFDPQVVEAFVSHIVIH